MVTLRKSTRRLGRPSTSATKTTKSTRSVANRSSPAPSVPIPPVPMIDPSIPAPFFNITDLIPPISPVERFDFAGIQYSPYFLTSVDNPGSSIITETLDGTNYNTWSIAITIALDAKNKLSFVDGSLPRPSESHAHYRIWSWCNSIMKSWILNSVTKQIYGSILRFNDASEIWQDLLVRFHITNLPRSYQLTQQIWSLHQGASDLSTYYTKLKTLWDDLDGAECMKTCKNCTCCKANSVRTEHTKVIKFLAGLNESYTNARSQIIMKKNVPTLSEVYNLLDQDHSQRTIQSSPPAAAFNVAVPDSSQALINATALAKHGRPVCSHCGNT